MIQLKLLTPTQTFVLDPLDGLIIPSNMQLNDSLQHQEAQVSVRVAYDSNVHKALVENTEIQAQIFDNNIPVFTGIIDTGITWMDNGNPEPLDNISLVINDLSYKLQQTTDGEFAYVNESLDNVVSAICAKCGLIYNHNYKAQNITVPVFILKQEQDFYQALNDLLFENLFSFGFAGNGTFTLIDLTQTTEDEEITDLLAGVKFSRTKKKFTGIKISYGKLIKKENEQIYFEGGNLNEDSKVVPYIITPGSYYPVEATPVVEEENGQVFQDFSQGFAEVKTLYNGEKKLQKSENTRLIYSTDHVLVKDWSDNLTVDRKEFQFTQASVRFYNASETDAELHQLAIKATAYYKETVEYILGTGKKYNYDTSFIYENEKAEQFAAFLTKYFLGGNYKVTFKTDTKLTPGQKVKIDLGLSGVKAQVLILNVTENLTSQNYEVTAITEQEITLDSTKYQLQKSMTADQRIQRTEYPTAIKEIQEEYYLSTSRTVLENGEWTTTPPTNFEDRYIWTRTSFIYENGIKTTTDPISVSGSNGDNIESVDVEYAQNQSRTTAPTTGWQTTAPTSKDGYYIWTRTKVKIQNKEATYTQAVCITGDKGDSGESGVGIAAITNYYLATNATTVTTATPGWTTTIQSVSSSKKYLWNYEIITYTDNSKTTTTPVIIGNYSENGTDGVDGIGIKSIAEKYAVSTSNTTAPTTWQATPPQMTATNKYLWNYEIITYSNNTTEETAKRVIGAYGDKGVDGKDGTDGKNAITMTSATTPNGEYNGQIGIWRGQVYSWNGTSWVLTSGIVPTDPVLHYSFDDLPDIPDGTNNFTGSVAGANYTKKDIKGGYRFTLNGKAPYVHFKTNIGAVDSLALCYRQKAISKTGGVYTRESYIFYTDSSYSNISNFIPVPTEAENIVKTTIPCDKTKTVAYIRLDMFTGEGHSAVIEVTDMYIGDASYTTPIIDNSGNNHNATGVKGLATKGVSGKCLRSLSAIDTGFTTKNLPLSANWSYSVWANLESEKLLAKANEYDDYNSTYTGMATMLFGVNNAYNSYGIEILCNNMFSGTKTVAVNVFERNQNSSEIKSYTISSKVVDKGFVNITVSRDDSNTKIYCDGIFVGSFSKIKTDLEIDKIIGINVAGYQGRNYRTRSTDFIIDDFQIFDRALSDQEVLGLYLARGNTPKQFTLNDYRLNLIDDDGVISVSEKKELLSRWKEIYNAKNVSSVLPTSNITATGEFKAIIDASTTQEILNIDKIQSYIAATNAIRDAMWGANGYLTNLDNPSTLTGSLDSLFATYRQTAQDANNAISQQQASKASAITVITSNEYTQMPVDEEGNVTSYEYSGNTIQVLNGTTVLTPTSASTLADNQYKVTASGTGITAGSVAVGTDKVTIGNPAAMTKNVAEITYTITVKVNGVQFTLYAVQKISKASRGADARIYMLTTANSTVVKSPTGTLTPASVTVEAKSYLGSNVPASFACDFYFYENNVQIQKYQSVTSASYSPTGNYPVVVKIRKPNTTSTATVLDQLSIPILNEIKGDKGEQGVRGSLEFSGTEINAISDITEATYTITTASTGILSATMPILVGDTYINVTTQDVWICSTAGTPTTAKWKYQGRRCSDKDDSNRFRMFTPATDNGTSAGNTLTKSVVKGENPFGKIDDLLKITNTNGPVYTNYTPYSRRTKIDPKKTYRYVAYIKQEDANYTDYFGLQGYITSGQYIGALSTGTAVNAAYFTNANNFGTLGRWYMVVGYVVANGTTTAPADSGVYDMITKQKVRTVTNFQWLSTATAILQMGTLIRYAVSASTKTGTAYLYDVRLDEVNGTEPSLNELLNLDTTTKSKGTWTASTVYNTGDIVYLNGNSYICIANHTSGTSFATTNWNLIASKGADGEDGTDGKGISSVTNYYLATNDTTVTTSTPGWTTTIQKVAPEKKYLWNYEIITYTDNSKTTTTPVIIGNYSSNGIDGKGIVSIVEKYATNNFSTTAPTVWQDTPPLTTPTSKYLWNYEIITYTDKSKTETSPVIIGVHGQQGQPGLQGDRGPTYKGAFATPPTSDVEIGDWYLDTDDGFVHVYNGSNWNNTISDYSDSRYSIAINDMINLAATNPNVPFLSVTNAWIKNLAAGNILANEIATQTLELKDDGVIKSNYVEGESGFIIKSDGNVEFNNGVIKTPELNFAGVKGLDDNLLKNGYRLKPIFNDWGQGYFGDEPVYKCAGYNSDGKVVALYLGCSYELSFSGTLNIYLAKNEYIYCSENCKSVNFRTVISDVSFNNTNSYPTIGSSVRNTFAFTKTSSNFWSANVADKIFSVPVKAGQHITCFVEALLSAPVENVGTIYSSNIESSGTSNAFKESAIYIKKENKIVKDLLKANEKVFNESIYLTRGTGVYDVRGVGFAGNYFLIGNVLVQWGQTKSYTVQKGGAFTETINLPIAYNDAGNVVGNATGLNGFNVIMSSSTKNNGGGMEYAEIWEQRTNSSFTVRTYNRNESTTIEGWSLRWMTIGYLD